jgi:hypothetical protein
MHMRPPSGIKWRDAAGWNSATCGFAATTAGVTAGCAITACCTGTVETKTGGLVLAKASCTDTCNKSDVLRRRRDNPRNR